MARQRRTSRLLAVAIVALSGAGVWISGQLVKQHADVWGSASAGTGLFAQVCQVAERAGLRCAEVAGNRWAEVQLPVPTISSGFRPSLRRVVVPVAFLSLAYFVLMGVWHAAVGPPRPLGREWHRLILAIGWCGVATSLFYLSLMALQLSPWCVWCVALHGINFVVVLLIWRMSRSQSRSVDAAAGDLTDAYEAARLTLTTREAVSAIAFAMIIVAGLGMYRDDRIAVQHQIDKLVPYRQMIKSLREDPQFLLREHLAQARHEIPLHPDEPVAADRPELVVFSNYACGNCYCAWRAVQERYVALFDGQLVVRVRHCPLTGEADGNAGRGESFDPDSPGAAAYVAEAARLQGGNEAMFSMHELLLRHRRELGRDTYRRLAAEIGLDPDRLLDDMQSPQVRQVVQADASLARKLGVTATPTLFFDGRRVTELCEGAMFWRTMARRWLPASDEPIKTASRSIGPGARYEALGSERE